MSTAAQFKTPVKFRDQVFTASAAQTVLTLTTITVPNSDILRVNVIVNGKEQPNDAYTVDTPTQITISEGLELNDHVKVQVPGY